MNEWVCVTFVDEGKWGLSKRRARRMSNRKRWDDLFVEASQEVESWRRKHKKATLTEIEETVDDKLARLRAKMIEDMAMASEVADLRTLAWEERPKCPQCGRLVAANGQQKRELTTDHEQAVELKRSKAYCQHCELGFFPSG
jgi:hypothetical protein